MLVRTLPTLSQRFLMLFRVIVRSIQFWRLQDALLGKPQDGKGLNTNVNLQPHSNYGQGFFHPTETPCSTSRCYPRHVSIDSNSMKRRIGYCITDREQTMGSSRSSASWLANHPSPLLYFFRRLHFALTTTGWNLIWFLAFLFWGRALARRGGFSRSIVGGATGIYQR